MRLITGDECGLIKETIPEIGRPPRIDSGPVNQAHPVTLTGIKRIDESPSARQRGVVDLAFCDEKHASFAALRNDMSVQKWEPDSDCDHKSFGTYKLRNTLEECFPKEVERKSRPLSIASLPNHGRLCVANTAGMVSILKDSGVVETYDAFASTKQKSTIGYTKGQYTNHQVCSAMAVESSSSPSSPSSSSCVALSGRERETTLVDLNTGKEVWKAKNLPPDPQTLLQQPVWTTALSFGCSSPHVLVAGTAYRQVRLYDVRSNTRRPVATTPEEWLQHRVTCLQVLPGQNDTIVVADGSGGIYAVDPRLMQQRRNNHKRSSSSSSSPMLQTTLPRYVGPVGSVRSMQRHPTEPLLACVGLDRMLRIYDTTKRKMLDCVYLKQRLNTVLFCNDASWDKIQEVWDGNTEAQDEVQDYIDSDTEEPPPQQQQQQLNINKRKEAPVVVEADDEDGEESSSDDEEDGSDESEESVTESSQEDDDDDDDDDDEESEEEDAIEPLPRKKRRH